MSAIVTLTMNPALDMTTATEVIVPTSKVRCDEPRYDPGGGGINVARAVHMLGGDALAVFPVGGLAGAMVRQLLDREGLPQAVVAVDGASRQSLAVVERSTGNEYRFVLPGPPISPRDQQRCLDELAARAAGASFIVASGSLPPGAPVDFYARVARLARDLGIRFALDTSGPALTDAGSDIYMIKASLRELHHLAGTTTESEEQQEAAARAVVAQERCEILVVSLGINGALYVTAQGSCRRHRAVPVKVQTTVGAGDSMLAGIILSLVRGWQLDDAVRFGMAAGTAAVLRPGTELCAREDTERLYREMAISGNG
jgi:6-phosphofructokinase 2